MIHGTAKMVTPDPMDPRVLATSNRWTRVSRNKGAMPARSSMAVTKCAPRENESAEWNERSHRTRGILAGCAGGEVAARQGRRGRNSRQGDARRDAPAAKKLRARQP